MNDYSYIDPDRVYTDPETGILRNKLNIKDQNALMFAEAAATAKRTSELRARPIRIKDARALFAIHRHLFQDIYEWAGERRIVEISKGGKQFFLTSHFDNALAYIDGLLAEYKRVDKKDRTKLSGKLAEILDTVNYMHPFREGNGRTQREFIRLLAMEKGWRLNLNPPDNIEVYRRYMNGTVNGDIKALAELLSDILQKDE